jgi:hypothetical protein
MANCPPLQRFSVVATETLTPNARHWHGAASDRLFIHLAMSEVSDTGAGTEWFEKVSDEDYTKTPEPV